MTKVDTLEGEVRGDEKSKNEKEKVFRPRHYDKRRTRYSNWNRTRHFDENRTCLYDKAAPRAVREGRRRFIGG